jgi:hypothetical protein
MQKMQVPPSFTFAWINERIISARRSCYSQELKSFTRYLPSWYTTMPYGTQKKIQTVYYRYDIDD